MDDDRWRSLLAERFPDRDAADAENAWAALKSRFSIGDEVTGVVVARAHFGAWIDFGVGFPGLLQIIQMADMNAERYRADDWCPEGSQVTAFIDVLADSTYRVGLWQVRPKLHES